MDGSVTRSSFFFECEDDPCAATLDLPPDGMGTRSTGLLIVTGGNELRSGPHGSQAAMAAHFATHGFPVFRYDRRGVGDSAGENTGWRGAEADLTAAVAAFRAACPELYQVVGFGNCDGASSLALYARAAGLAGIILANPWAFDHDGEAAPSDDAESSKPEHSRASALRYYRRRLADPVGLLRDLFGGKVNLGQAMSDAKLVSKAASATATGTSLAHAMRDWGDRASMLLAKDDRTALYFQEQMAALGHPLAAAQFCPTTSHSFADDAARQWLYRQIETALNAP